MRRRLIALLTLPLAAAALVAEPPAGPPAFAGLGTHTRPVSANADAQAAFDQGLAFLYAFNHDEAIRGFERAAALDPECPMAQWGIALANGGHINKPVIAPDRAKAAGVAVGRAERHVLKAKPADVALIAAIAVRFTDRPGEDQEARNKAYTAAMKAAWEKFPTDADVGAVYAESLMNLRPWDLWTADGKPRDGTPELVATLEAVLKLNPRHPFALHLYIHAVEASPDPGRADGPADRLRDLCPGLGHLVHMPSHIDVKRGRWQRAVAANEKAVAADAAYRERSPDQGFYRLYMAHNHHMLAFAAMMQGQSGKALATVREMVAGVPKEWVAVKENAAIADGFLAAPLEVLLRFGRWDDVLKEPEPPALFPIARGLRHHARGVALAATGKAAEARQELAAMRAVVKAMPAEAAFGNNPAADIFAVADPMLEGEILAAEGKLTEAIASLTAAVAKEDALKYAEPPDWIIPVRHPLGAFLLKDGQAEKAEVVYRQDLKKWPENGWALRGLATSLERQGKAEGAEAAKQRFERAWKHADVRPPSSCYCVPGR